MKTIIGAEIMLLLASILVFRGVWLFLDMIPWFGTAAGLAVSLGAGLAVSLVALYRIHGIANKPGGAS